MTAIEPSIEVAEWGDGDALFVLLHASATGPRSLTRLANRLSRADRSIIAPAFAGYAQTQLTDAATCDRLNTNRSIVRKVLKRRSTGQCILFGHSMGGLIALLTALDEERRGNAFDALVLYEPLLIDLLDLQDVAHAKAHAWDRAIIDNLNRQVRDGHQESGVRHFIESWNETNWEALPNTARQQLVANADNLALETVAVSKQKIDRSRLDTFVMPTLLVRGSCSPTLIALTTEIAASVIPNARQSIIPDCGHMGPLLKPAPIAVCIESFLHTLTAQSQQQEPR
jgi:pimeloyl-ACP methyl ester carboxylesterase